MRIEPASRSQARQKTTRRHSADLGNMTKSAPSERQNASTQEKSGTALVQVSGQPHSTYARTKSARRWRSHVPFLAHYIGQETAKETSARSMRRNPEKAQKAYEIRLNQPIHPRTLAQV